VIKVIKEFLSLVFPPRCIFCGRFLSIKSQQDICEECYGNIPFSGSFDTHMEQGLYFDRLICLCEYSGIIKHALVNFKFHNKPRIGRTLGKLLSEKLRKMTKTDEFDIITCVPLHRKRYARRGYNQSELICRELHSKLDIPFNRDMLVRIRDTEPQSLLSGCMRHDNVKDAFSIKNGSKTEKMSVLLVDDIMTTGSTLNECAKVLKDRGAARVTAAVIASGRKY